MLVVSANDKYVFFVLFSFFVFSHSMHVVLFPNGAALQFVYMSAVSAERTKSIHI